MSTCLLLRLLGTVALMDESIQIAGNLSDAAVSVRNVYKLFGGDVDAGIALAREGASKAEVQEASGAVMALSDVSFDAAEGEIFVVMGLSGCGKSTLIRCINRLIDPTAGEISVGGVNVTDLDVEDMRDVRRKSLAMVFQHYGLLPHRTVVDNVALGLEMRGVGIAERRKLAHAALETVGLDGWGASKPEELSGGMMQRVGLARALAHDTPVLLMDEPFSALDPLIRNELQDELVAMQGKLHKTIIFITHDLDEAVRIGDRIAIMRDGVIVQVGTPMEVVLHPADAYVREFTSNVRQNALMTAGVVMSEATHVVESDAKAIDVLDDLFRNEQTYTLVIDGAGRYVGTALLQRIQNAMPDDDLTVGQTEMMMEPGVGRDVVLDELVPLGLRSEHPIPVLDDDGLLVGEVLLETLADAMDAEQDV